MGELDVLFPIPESVRNADDMGMPTPLKPEHYGLPPYPDGEVVGPCVCGSWPGGKCLKCKVSPTKEKPEACPKTNTVAPAKAKAAKPKYKAPNATTYHLTQ